MKKWIRRIGISLCALLLLMCGVVHVLWHNEISSVLSIQEIVPAKEENSSGPVYLKDVQGDYYFDEYLGQGGAENDGELIDFVVGNITKGIIPVSISSPEIGCSSFTIVDENGTVISQETTISPQQQP